MAASDHLGSQFYHGSPHKFSPGDTIQPGHESRHTGIPNEHVFLSSSKRNAKLWGGSADDTGSLRGGHVYEVSNPTTLEPDEAGNQATNTKANYRTKEPVTVIRKVKA